MVRRGFKTPVGHSLRKMMNECKGEPHTHVTESGFVVKCYHSCKNVLREPAFWFGVTITFPIEHFLWTKVPGFSHLTEWLGLFDH